MKIDGRFWLTKEDQPFLGRGRVELLEKIEKTGSIHAAAKEMKMSYKAAWDRMDAMNRLAGVPLLERTVGGKGGGGTLLTDHARQMITHYRRLEELHKEFLDRFGVHADNPDELARLLGRLFVTTSARNQLFGKVKTLKENGVNTEVLLELAGGGVISSVITTKACRDLALKEECEAYAIIKSSDVTFLLESPTSYPSGTVIEGMIASIETAGERSEISLYMQGGGVITGVVDHTTSSTHFVCGEKAFACIPSTHVIIGV